MICSRNFTWSSFSLTLLSCALLATVACGSGVTIDGDDWQDDAYTAQDSDFFDVEGPDKSHDTSHGDVFLDDAKNNTENDTADTTRDIESDTENDTNNPESPFDNQPAIYPFDRVHSPLTPYVAHHLRTIARQHPHLRDDVFSKIGDSLTVNTGFMHCFSSSPDLSGFPGLQTTADYFLAGQAGTTNPYTRQSLAAGVGWSTRKTLESPSLLDAELDTTLARYGLVMFGTNNIGGDGTGSIYTYGADMLTIADQMLARGTIPVFTSIPWRADNATANRAVPRFNAVARAVAQSRQVPFIDLSQTWAEQPARGLLNDGIHLNSFQQGCNFNETGLSYGHNARNLATLQQLKRLHGVLESEAATAPDASGEPLHGDGSSSDPIIIPGLPFIDSRNTGTGGQSTINTYPGCAATQNESGNEFIYRFHTNRAVKVRAFVIVRAPTDVDVHLLDNTATGAGCLARNDREVIYDLAPGTYHFALDTFVSASGSINSGEYLFVLLEEK